MAHERPGHRALDHLDLALRERPHRNDHALAYATQCLGQFRDGLIGESREKGLSDCQRQQLRHVNAVITVILGVRFPLGDLPWDELEKARAWLQQAVDLDEPG